MEMYFKKPAETWEETLPIGNGHLGGMIWGAVEKEKIGLNDGRLWSGYPYDKNNLEAKKYLAEIREKIFVGENPQAEKIVSRYFTGNYTESYLPLGNLFIEELSKEKEVMHFKRSLNLEDAAVKLSYKTPENRFEREYFASFPNRGIFASFKSEKATSYSISFETELKHQLFPSENQLDIHVQAPEHVDPSYLFDAKNPIIQGTRGSHHHYEIVVFETDGTVSLEKATIEIHDCTYFHLIFKRKEDQPLLNYQKAKENHLKDYQELFKRQDLNLGEQLDLPMDERIKRLQSGEKDPGLFALYFQYGRYLLISSSRKGGTPANLQGIWNWHMRAPWSSNYTTNINLEMNYWSCDMCYLKECFEPYSEFIKELSQKGKETAAAHYGTRGSVVHHNSDIWGTTNPVGRRYREKMGDDNTALWSMWNMAGCWLASDLYRHYEYTEDQKFLEGTVYPVLEENMLFLCDYLIKKDGLYHSTPSSSPENAFYNDKGEASSLTYSSTMDLCLMKENLTFYLNACQLLNKEPLEKEKIEDILTHLPEIKVGSLGQILEWQKEYREVEPGHRHVSHLYGLFPGNLYNSEELKAATKKSLALRMENGGGYTGWSNAWVTNLFVRLKEKEKVYERLEEALCRASYPNLWSKHPPFQIDGNLGILSAFIQMCVQVNEKGEVSLLPSLPAEFSKKGHLYGACLPGNKVLDLSWENGVVIESSIKIVNQENKEI